MKANLTLAEYAAASDIKTIRRQFILHWAMIAKKGFNQHLIDHTRWYEARFADHIVILLIVKLLETQPSAATLKVREAWKLAQPLLPLLQPQITYYGPKKGGK